jgi:hypothetical protein
MVLITNMVGTQFIRGDFMNVSRTGGAVASTVASGTNAPHDIGK